MNVIKAVHGLVWVGFVSNPELTHQNRVRKKCTRRRPAGVIGSDGSNHQQVSGGSVGVINLRRQRENGEKTQIRRINADSGDSFPDSDEISLRSKKSHWIWWDFSRSCQNLTGSKGNIAGIWVSSPDSGKLSPDSGNFGRDLEIFAGIWKSFGLFGFFGF